MKNRAKNGSIFYFWHIQVKNLKLVQNLTIMSKLKKLCSSYKEQTREEFLYSLHDHISQTLLTFQVTKRSRAGKMIIVSILAAIGDLVISDSIFVIAIIRKDHDELIKFLKPKTNKP